MPKFLPGDIVRRGDELRRVEQFLTSDETGGWDPVLMTNKGGESDIENWEKLEAREAFAVTGFPVPEGAKITRYENGLWMALTDTDHAGFRDGWDWRPATDKLAVPAYDYCPNLARTPFRDCENIAPPIVRERLEAMLGGGA